MPAVARRGALMHSVCLFNVALNNVFNVSAMRMRLYIRALYGIVLALISFVAACDVSHALFIGPFWL